MNIASHVNTSIAILNGSFYELGTGRHEMPSAQKNVMAIVSCSFLP